MPMDRMPSAPAPASAAYIGDRYRVERELGRGGMADVYECVNEATGVRVAVKKLHAHRAGDEHLARLFELEFHTLAQLAHPRIVEVHDYHKVQDAAFYTMELLAGDDLRDRQVPWKVACALLCDVCSALSLLHSRRLVHRDVTPRNIRRTPNGNAKLIDFGAMVPFGTHRRIVGTPAFTPPEAATCQPLDGRADLYAVGATAYFILTGRHAYPARSFDGLRNAWRSRPAVPSRYVLDIPPDLDQLVMWLLALAPSQRPPNAAAVMERLTAIAGLQLDGDLHAQRAFLSTPSLVGRDLLLQNVRRQAIHASRGRGTTLLLTGPNGVGRSRMIDACALEGKLANAVVLRADASDADAGEWGVARAMLDQLLTEIPGKAEELIRVHATILGHVWPRALDLAGGAPPHAFERAHETRPAVQESLLSLITEVSRHAFVLVTADDLERIDEPTRAFLALLAQRVVGRRLMVVSSATSDAVETGFEGLQLLQGRGDLVALDALSPTETERLVISMFGEVPNVRLLASRLHELSGGVPAATLQLAQYLLDHDVISCRDGAWILPTAIDRSVLPSSISAAMSERLRELDAASLTLARAIALNHKPSVSLEECARFLPELPSSQVLDRIDALVSARILNATQGRYSLSQPGWTKLLLAELDAETKCALHARCAEALAREARAEFERASHLIASGSPEPAIDLLLEYGKNAVLELAVEPTRLSSLIHALPADWMATLDAAIDAADRGGRPRRQRLALRQLFMQLPKATQPRPEVARAVATQLESDSGLLDYAELGDEIPADQRIKLALARATERYRATPEADRGLPPADAIPALARAITQTIGMMAATADHAFLSSLPSLAPYVSLSPALAIVHLNLQSTCDLIAGRVVSAQQGYLECLEKLAGPGDIGLSPTVRMYMHLAMTYAVASVETIGGLPDVSDRIDQLERDPLFEVGAWRLRMLAALRQGDVATADSCERKAELIRIRNPPTQFFEGADTWYEVMVQVEIGDVARIRQALGRLDVMAEKFPTWAAPPYYARGHILRLRGDAEAAVALFESGLAKVRVGVTSSWTALARGYLLALTESERVADARDQGAQFLQQARDAGLKLGLAEIHRSLASTELAACDFEAARSHLDSVDKIREQWPGGAVFRGACDELRARVALAMRDPSAFGAAALSCGRSFLQSGHPILIARHQRLLQDAEREGLLPPSAATTNREPNAGEDVTAAADGSTQAELQLDLSECRDFEQRVARVILLATEQGDGRHAMLYLLRDGVPNLVGQRGSCPDPDRMKSQIVRYLHDELRESSIEAIDSEDLITSTVDNSGWMGPTGIPFAPALMSHSTAEGRAITGVFVFDLEGQRHPDDALLAALSLALTQANDVAPLIVPWNTQVPARMSVA